MTESNTPPLMVLHDFDANASGAQLEKTPLHLTIVPFFNLGDVSQQQAIDVIAEVSRSTRPFEVTTGSEAMYGPESEVPVTIVNNTDILQDLHAKLIDALGNIGCEFVDRTYTKDKYSPHISHQPGADIPPSPILIDSLTIFREDKRVIKLISI